MNNYYVFFIQLQKMVLTTSIIFSPLLLINYITNTIFNILKIDHEEDQYLNLIKEILEKGDTIKSRNGNVKAIFGNKMEFDLSNNKLPLLTTKKVAYKTCIKELLWFMRGQ